MQELYKNDDVWMGYAFQICGNKNKARDLVQDMYLKAHDLLLKNPDKKISRGYVWLILRSIYIDGIRKGKKMISVDTLTEYFDSEDDGNEAENAIDNILLSRWKEMENEAEQLSDRKMVDQGLRELGFMEREVLLLTSEKSLRQIAKESGVNYQQIHIIKREALPKLKSILCRIKKKNQKD